MKKSVFWIMNMGFLLILATFGQLHAQGEELSRFATEKDWAGWNRAISYPDTVKKLYVDDEDESFHTDSLRLFPKLTGLYLDGAEAEDVLFVNDLPELRVLEMHETGLKSLNGIDTLQHLEELIINGNYVSSVAPLDSMHTLKILKLYFNRIADISPLGTHTQLTTLDLGRNPITTIDTLAGLTNLKHFSVFHCQKLQDVSVVKNFTDLIDLNISMLKPNPEFSLSLISDHKKLQNLKVQGVVKNNDELQYIRNKIFLTQLTMGKNPGVTNIDTLASLSGLTYLDIHSCNVDDISVIEHFPMLVKLVCYRNKIADISPVTTCLALQSLFMHENPIRTFKPLLEMQRLEVLHLSPTQLTPQQQVILKDTLGETNIVYY